MHLCFGRKTDDVKGQNVRRLRYLPKRDKTGTYVSRIVKSIRRRFLPRIEQDILEFHDGSHGQLKDSDDKDPGGLNKLSDFRNYFTPECGISSFSSVCLALPDPQLLI